MGPWLPEYEEWANYHDYIRGGAAAHVGVGFYGDGGYVLADTYTYAHTRQLDSGSFGDAKLVPLISYGWWPSMPDINMSDRHQGHIFLVTA
jgi:hypothetical protein